MHRTHSLRRRSTALSSSLTRLLTILALVAPGVLGSSAVASAEETIIKSPNPPKYVVEIEPHLNSSVFNWDYAGTSYGPGVRFSIPVLSPGFVKTIDDSVAISFGADFIQYSGYTYGCDSRGCYDTNRFWSTYVPVAMQWNFWLTNSWSVFAEPGLTFRHTFQDDYCNQAPGYDCRKRDRLLGTFYIGGRLHLSDNLALTLRVGYPTGLSIGLSIF